MLRFTSDLATPETSSGLGILQAYHFFGGLKRTLTQQVDQLRQTLSIKNIALFENCYNEFKDLMALTASK